MRWRAPPKQSSMPSCDQALGVHARADAGGVEQVDRAPARARRRGCGRARSRASRCSRITSSMPALGSSCAEQQAGRAGADDGDLRAPRRAHVASAAGGRACQRASSSASRARVSLPLRRGSPSGGRPSSSTAATVCSSGRVVSRVCSARWMSTREWPRSCASVEAIQSGSSVQGVHAVAEQEVLGHRHRLGRRRAAFLGFVLAGGDQLAPAAGRAVRRPGAVEGAALRRARPGGPSRRRGRARR